MDMNYPEFLSYAYLSSIYESSQSVETECFEKRLLRSLVNSKVLTEEETFLVEESFGDESYMDFFVGGKLYEESLLQKFKDKTVAAVQVLKAKGKEALNATQEVLIKIGGGIEKIIKLIMDKIGAIMMAGGEKFKQIGKQIIADGKKKAEEVMGMTVKDKEKTAAMEEDLKNGKGDMTAGAGFALGKFSKKTGQAAAMAAKADDGEEKNEQKTALQMYNGLYENAFVYAIDKKVFLREELLLADDMCNACLNEDDGPGSHIPYMGTLMKKLKSFPPFNLLDKIKAAAEKFASSVLSKISFFISKLAEGPGPFTYSWLGAQIAGLTVGKYLDKFDATKVIKGFVENLIVTTVPALGIVWKILKWSIITLEYIALAITIAGLAIQALGDKAPDWAKDAVGKVEKTIGDAVKKDEKKDEKNESIEVSESKILGYNKWLLQNR